MPPLARDLPHSDIAALSISALATHYAERILSPVEVCDAMLIRIETAGPLFRPFLMTDPEGARLAAQAAEARYRDNAPLGPLDGIPISFKLHFLVAGMPAAMGCGPRSRLDAIQQEDEPAVALLRRAGMVFTGKTLSPENPYVASSLNRLLGTSLNPWDRTRTAGGSSAGAAAAAAARLGPVHFGSDGGGSIRLPASYCGAVGIKPSYGVIPDIEADPFAAAVYGPLAADIEDVSAVLAALAPAVYGDAPALPLAGARVGTCAWVGGDAFKPTQAMLTLLDRVAERLGRSGAQIIPVAPFMPEGWWDDLVRGVVATYARGSRSGFSDAEYAALLPDFRHLIEKMAKIDDTQCVELNARWQGRNVPDPLEGLDALILATTPDVAHDAALYWPASAQPDPFHGIAMPHVAQTGFFNFRNYPAASLPMGLIGGLPAGLQLVTPRGADRTMLGYARTIARLLDPAEMP